MIYAGKISDIRWSDGTWVILDIGFSNSRKSCGMLQGDGATKKLQFNDAVNEVVRIAKDTPLLNLVIEAPLSVAFDKYGNPKVRSIDKKGKQSRPWYVGPGCAVMVAAMYLVRILYDSQPPAEVRLFEGFVSFKSKGNKSSHSDDVKYLRNAIKGEDTRNHNLYKPEEFKEDECDNIMSAFKLMSMDLGIPPVIKIDG
jgi:hypothetical protein